MGDEPLVVVPGDNLGDMSTQDGAGLRVDDGRRPRADEVARDELQIRHLEDVLAYRVDRALVSEGFEKGVDGGDGGAEVDRQVDHRNVCNWHSDTHA